MSLQSDAVSLNLCGSDLLNGDCDYPGIYSNAEFLLTVIGAFTQNIAFNKVIQCVFIELLVWNDHNGSFLTI